MERRLGYPAFCFVFEEHGFDELEDDGLFFGGEVLGGFEGEFEVVGGFSFVGFEREVVDMPD